MIDLHLHTTASDGRLSPEALVGRAARAGLTVISVTDHDTTAGLAAAAAAADAHGLRLVNGIEISAVENCRDIHVLGYFFDPESAELASFLDAQRLDRQRRLVTMAERLRELGYTIDIATLLGGASRDSGRTLGRPHLADALVQAGYVASRREAFDDLLGEGRPAFVPRRGAPVGEVAAIIRSAGGITSLAHPGVLGLHEQISRFAEAGLGAVEVWHSDHDADAVERYSREARRLGLGMSGGSDFHADDSHHAAGMGAVAVPVDAFLDLESRVNGSRRAR